MGLADDLADGLAANSSLEGVHFEGAWPQAQADSEALGRALLSLPLLRTLDLARPPAPVLARLLGCRALKSLRVHGDHAPLLDSPAAAAALCDALRANTRLETLTLNSVRLWHDMDAATALLAALQTLPALRLLHLPYNQTGLPEDSAAAGAALGALIAHAPALLELDTWSCALELAGLGPIMDALPRARCLRTLRCKFNLMREVGAREAFARARLLPAVRACASLRTLEADFCPAVEEAIAMLKQRS